MTGNAENSDRRRTLRALRIDSAGGGATGEAEAATGVAARAERRRAAASAVIALALGTDAVALGKPEGVATHQALPRGACVITTRGKTTIGRCCAASIGG
uniref:hypothetical protein n=1 Tax=Amycolatopsis sp. CA-096443 TaxID=3239919 RepID=UPI003F494AF2